MAGTFGGVEIFVKNCLGGFCYCAREDVGAVIRFQRGFKEASIIFMILGNGLW